MSTKTKVVRKPGAKRYRKKVYKPRAITYARPKIGGSGAYRVKKNKSQYYDSIGGRLGNMAGHGLQQLVKYITGFGDYKIEANSLMGGIYDPPELHNEKARSVVIRHREYLTDITATSAFTTKSFAINPGMDETFPWLSSVAQNFEEYRITGMIFEYKTLSADYTTASSAALGYVAMATQYNVYNPPFDNKKMLENYEFSNSGKPSDTFIHPVECKKSLSPVSELFVRTGNITQGDQRLYDLGTFYIATGGNTGNGVLGELWCTFEVEFFKPKLVTNYGNIESDHWQASTGTVANATPLGTSANLAPNSSIGTTINFATQTLSFPSHITDGDFLVIYCMRGSVAAVITGLTVTATNCTKKTQWFNDSTNIPGTPVGTNTTDYYLPMLITVTGPGATLAFGSSTLPTTVTVADLFITNFNAAIDI